MLVLVVLLVLIVVTLVVLVRTVRADGLGHRPPPAARAGERAGRSW